MKTQIRTTIILSIIFTLFIQSTAWSKNKGDYTLPTKKEFSINKGATLKINSEFTDIKAYNWDKDIISIEVTIYVDARNEEKAESKFKKVSIEMNGTESLVELTTGLKSSFKGNNNNNLEIDALIYYPPHIKLDLDVEFGNCIFENIDGAVKTDLAYSNFEAGMLNNSDLDLNTEFGKINLRKFQSGKVDVAYGTFNTKYAGMLNLESEFSTVEIEELNQIELETAYDKIYIDNCDNAFIKSEFSGIRIDQVNNSLDMGIAYGSFSLKSVSSQFEKINIRSEFTGLSLYFKNPIDFAFDVSAEMGDFKYPKDLATITYLEKEMMELDIKGYFGNAKDQAPKLILSLENASASIKIIE